ncbi:hypothetical protein FY048_19120, partial [Acinetobacter sp. 1124_18A]|uniref:calcium-binding protein n=1 Tax=Acinetobacter sp. 1124_18A TaxID=2605958 RepID=UPI004059D6D1
MSYDTTINKTNTLQLKEGITASDIILKQVSDPDVGGNSALEVSISGSTDKITFNGFLYQDSPVNNYNSLQRIEFADGTSLTVADILTKL